MRARAFLVASMFHHPERASLEERTSEGEDGSRKPGRERRQFRTKGDTDLDGGSP